MIPSPWAWIFSFGCFSGGGTGAFLWCRIAAQRMLDARLGSAPGLPDVPGVMERAFATGPGERWVGVVMCVVIAATQWWAVVMNVVQREDASGIPTWHFALLFSPFALMAFCASLVGLLLILRARSYARVAAEVVLDLRCTAELSVFAYPLVLVAGVVSVMFALLGASVALFDSWAESAPLFVFGLVASLVGLTVGAWPIWRIHQRIVVAVAEARQAVIARMDEEAPATASLEAGAVRPLPASALYAQLAWLDELSTWPIGGYVERLAVFVILPPLSWAAAAMVENLLY